MKNNRTDNYNRGFTLSEIVFVITIFSVLVLASFAIFKGAFETWTITEARTQAFENARAALEQMAKELRCAVVNDRSDEKRFDFIGFGLDVDGNQPNNMSPPVWRAGSIADEVYFIGALNPGGDAEAEFCEAGYFLYDKDINKEGTEFLRRFYVTDTGHIGKVGPTGIFDYEFRTPTGQQGPSLQNTDVIAEGVVDFRVWYWSGDGLNDDNDQDAYGNSIIDEEVENNEDDDGDGRIDEDLGWQNSWDSRQAGFNDAVYDGREKGRLPPAVKIRISVRDEFARATRTFTTVISLPNAR